MIQKSNFNILQELYQKEGTYIGATVAYINFIGVEIEEFNKSDLPPEWLQCLCKEAKELKTLKPEIRTKQSFSKFIKKED